MENMFFIFIFGRWRVSNTLALLNWFCISLAPPIYCTLSAATPSLCKLYNNNNNYYYYYYFISLLLLLIRMVNIIELFKKKKKKLASGFGLQPLLATIMGL